MSRLLIECGKVLYGPQWQSALARDLGVADRTVRRWVAGTTDIPPGLCVDLLRLAQKRAKKLDALVSKLRDAAAQEG
jgi:DNA-binding transcriptional regulator YdaS (Cro superfamily)